MTPHKIDLVGLTHVDILGGQRLRTVLEQYAGCDVTIELPKSTVYEEQVEWWAKTRALASEAFEFALPPHYDQRIRTLAQHSIAARGFELQALEHAKELGVRLRYVDVERMFTASAVAENLAGVAGIVALHTHAQANSGLTYTSASDTQLKELLAAEMDKLYTIHFNTLIPPDHGLALNYDCFFHRTAYKLHHLSPQEPCAPPQQDPELREQTMLERILEFRPAVHIGGMAHTHEEFSSEELGGITPLCVRLQDRLGTRRTLLEAAQETATR